MIVQQQTRPGDMIKFVVKIDGKDITDAVTDAQVFEEIFSPGWTANVLLTDTTNLLMTLPIVPGGELTIEAETKMGTPADGSKEFKFIITGIHDKILDNPGTYKYALACADASMVKQATKRVSKGFTDKKVSDIVKTIAQEYMGGTVDVDETDQNISIIIPNESPGMAIARLSKVAVKNDAADFFFFQTDENKFAFKTLENMFSSENENLNITLTNKVTELTDNKSDAEFDYMLNIGQYYFNHYDSVSNLNTGYYKNKIVSYDLVSKKWESKVFTFGDDCKEDFKMRSWKNPIFDEAENASISFKPKHTGAFSKGLGVMETAQTWLPSRKSSVQKADQERLLAQIPGSVGCWKWLGKNITVDLPSQQEMTDEKKDKFRDGRYIVVCVAHMFSKAFYAVNLELVKKRLNEKPESDTL